MSKALLDFLALAKDCPTFDELTLFAGSSFADLGFSRWAYQAPPATLEAKPFTLHNFPTRWAEQYIASNYTNIDPVITHGSQRTSPFAWSDLYSDLIMTPSLRNYRCEAASVGLSEGVGIPIITPRRRASMLSAVSDESAKHTRQHLAAKQTELIAMALAFHCVAQDLRLVQHAPRNTVLTERERECLLWAFHGKSTWEISRIINRSERTVIFHLENAKKKFNTPSRMHAVIKAFLTGHIDP